MASFNNINSGSFSNVQGGSFSNIGAGSFGVDQKQDNKGLNFKGNLLENARTDFKTIGSDITTLAGAIFGFDKEARAALGQTFKSIADDPRNVKTLVDAVLSTYNIGVDDFGKMPLGEMVGNVIEGAWEHPITAALDVSSILALGYNRLPKSFKDRLPKVEEADVRVKLAEEVTKDNLKHHNLGQQFIDEIAEIERKYNSNDISKAMEAIETIGFKNAPRELLPIMNDLSKANMTYKQFVQGVGATILDDYDFAAKELMSKQTNIPFAEFNTPEFMKTKTYQDMLNYVKTNDIRPLFHLKPKIYSNPDLVSSNKIESSLLSRKYGTIDYADAPKNFSKKATEFVDKAIQTKVLDSADALNKKIEAFNEATGSKIKKVNASSAISSNKVLNEINRELKKTMLASGTYLGANVLSTTLSILNNFDLNAATKTFKNLPKFRLIELTEAETPLLNVISKINNKLYRPIASVDRWLENVAVEYIKNHPDPNVARYMQSAIPSKVVTTNEIEAAIKSLIPFGSYPVAAFKELVANIKGRPLRTLGYTQVAKVGEELNRQAQENVEGLQQPDTSEVIRPNQQGELIRRQTVVTPIQAANMFLLGEYGDAVQIPIYNFINKLVSGEGDPSVIEVDGKRYRVENGEIKTNKGSFNLIPSLAYIGRQLLGPVQFYNQVLVPLMSDKYIRDETKLFNQLVNDAQYANLGRRAKWKVQDNAKEKLGKRVLGTYEYDYWEDKVYPRTRQKIMRELRTRRQIERTLKRKD